MGLQELKVIEIFHSIQGEGSWMGIPCTFVRFSGCNLRCSWCDTKYAYSGGRVMKIGEIVGRIKYKHVILTGGEPGLYNLDPLIERLHEHGCIVAIETNGTVEVSERLDWVVCSPKPDANYIIRCKPDELKYVIDDRFSVDVIPHEFRGKINIWLQPNYFDFERSVKKGLKLVMEHEFLRLGVQLHKIYGIK